MYQAGGFLKHWLLAVNEHALHPPFAYELYTRVIKADARQEAFQPIEALRQDLLINHQLLQLKELGAGSGISNKRERAVSHIARHSLTTPRFSRLLYRLIRHLGAQNIIELGTSLGINTLYLSAAAKNGVVYTLEGCPQTAAIARTVFTQCPLSNIRLMEGNIDHTLAKLLESVSSVDAAYLDANHTYDASLRYFKLFLPKLHEDSFLVIDDIYWSEEMQRAWRWMQQHPQVSLSIDLYDAGLLFFRPGLQKAHYILAF